MTVSAIQQFVKDTIQGTVSPDWQSPLLSAVSVPIPGVLKLKQPLAFVWGASWREVRRTIPRATAGTNPTLIDPSSNTPVQAGWKDRYYTVSIWIYGAELPNDANRDTKFPGLIEQVMNTLRMVAIPQPIEDLKTHEFSTVLSIGEEFSAEYDVDRTFADQRTLRNECRLDVQVNEEFQF